MRIIQNIQDPNDDPIARLSPVKAHWKYARARQRPDQTARDFLSLMKALEARMEPYTEEQKLYHFYARLNPTLRAQVTNYMYGIVCADREELCDLCTHFENVYPQQLVERRKSIKSVSRRSVGSLRSLRSWKSFKSVSSWRSWTGRIGIAR